MTEQAKEPTPCANCGHESGQHMESAPSCWCGCASYVRSDAQVYVRHDDGTLVEAVPLGWQGHGIDWEVYLNEKPLRAEGYDEDVLLAVLTARTRWGLNRRMRRVEREHDLPRNGVLS